MAKRKFPSEKDLADLPPMDDIDIPEEKPNHFAAFFGRTFDVIKLLLGICLLPFVYSFTISFLSELSGIDKHLQKDFWVGVIALLLVYLFVWEPAVVYKKGQKLLELIFMFIKPLVKVAPYLLPIYTLVLFVLYLIFSNIYKWLLPYFIFLFGFTLALHLIFSAKSMKSRKSDFLKGSYIFGFSFIYIVNLVLAALCLNLIFEHYSFVGFFNNSFQIAQGIFTAVTKQLFLT